MVKRRLSTATKSSLHREQIRIRGIVQGVGFRPTVYRLAVAHGIRGEVYNDAAGVLVRAQAEPGTITAFLEELRAETPPLARIDAIERQPYGGSLQQGFHIVPSRHGLVRTAVVPDAATCPACLAELHAAGDRRYRYAFVNCTHCGPRLSIVSAIPYDRVNTTMRHFEMCAECNEEYNDAGNRRFHAQPNACPECGPKLLLRALTPGPVTPAPPTVRDETAEATARLCRGEILAVKGLGGFHLACNAADNRAVARLRRRKHRDDKPFALMARDVEVIRRYCSVGPGERALLQSPAAPIVLLAMHGATRLADAVAPGMRSYGFMLPYTPLHHLLMKDIAFPVVMTSGNLSAEPQCIDNDEACTRLTDIADAVLLHDRDIVNRIDDSVVQVVAGSPRILRRARGYAPSPLPLPPCFEQVPPVLAFGGELKNTFCLAWEGQAVLSQHLGDLEDARTNLEYRETLQFYLQMLDHSPRLLAVDRHPRYLSSMLGRQWAAQNGGRLIEVQHHHAHVAACLVENGQPGDAPPVLGIALDGLGYGDDGTMWGGEFLLADYRSCKRLATFATVPMPGGEQAIREPWRMAYAYLSRRQDWSLLRKDYAHLPFFRLLREKPLAVLDRMIENRVNSPWTSSCGRLFDAVAAVLGLRCTATYEGQAAMELEAAAWDEAAQQDEAYYALNIRPLEGTGVSACMDTGALWPALLQDVAGGVRPAVAAARFHRGLARGIVDMVAFLERGPVTAWQGRIALSGGVWQNALLSAQVEGMLQQAGYQLFVQCRIPPNDGGLSLGQAAVAAACFPAA